jgi:transposase-like protein
MESASSGKSRKARRKFTSEFKAEAIKLCSEPGQSIGKVAKNLDLTETALRAWVKQAKVDAGRGPVGALTTAERHELVELRKQVRQLTMEREILRKATAFFAKEQM